MRSSPSTLPGEGVPLSLGSPAQGRRTAGGRGWQGSQTALENHFLQSEKTPPAVQHRDGARQNQESRWVKGRSAAMGWDRAPPDSSAQREVEKVALDTQKG